MQLILKRLMLLYNTLYCVIYPHVCEIELFCMHAFQYITHGHLQHNYVSHSNYISVKCEHCLSRELIGNVLLNGCLHGCLLEQVNGSKEMFVTEGFPLIFYFKIHSFFSWQELHKKTSTTNCCQFSTGLKPARDNLSLALRLKEG